MFPRWDMPDIYFANIWWKKYPGLEHRMVRIHTQMRIRIRVQKRLHSMSMKSFPIFISCYCLLHKSWQDFLDISIIIRMTFSTVNHYQRNPDLFRSKRRIRTGRDPDPSPQHTATVHRIALDGNSLCCAPMKENRSFRIKISDLWLLSN